MVPFGQFDGRVAPSASMPQASRAFDSQVHPWDRCLDLQHGRMHQPHRPLRIMERGCLGSETTNSIEGRS